MSTELDDFEYGEDDDFPLLEPAPPQGWEDEEGLFVRDYEGRLLKLDPVTADDLNRLVTITIDGRSEPAILRRSSSSEVLTATSTPFEARTDLPSRLARRHL